MKGVSSLLDNKKGCEHVRQEESYQEIAEVELYQVSPPQDPAQPGLHRFAPRWC